MKNEEVPILYHLRPLLCLRVPCSCPSFDATSGNMAWSDADRGQRGVCVMQHEAVCRITCAGRSLRGGGDGEEVEKREERGV